MTTALPVHEDLVKKMSDKRKVMLIAIINIGVSFLCKVFFASLWCAGNTTYSSCCFVDFYYKEKAMGKCSISHFNDNKICTWLHMRCASICIHLSRI